jgi:hypothetical protein
MHVEGYPAGVVCAITIREVPDTPAMASDVEGLGLDRFLVAESFGPGVAVDLEDVRPLHGRGDDGRRAVCDAGANNRARHALVWKDLYINLEATMPKWRESERFL